MGTLGLSVSLAATQLATPASLQLKQTQIAGLDTEAFVALTGVESAELQ